MQIVIDIPKEDYETCKEQVKMIEQEGVFYESSDYALKKAIAKGIRLPKGHGRLIDVDEIDHYMLPSEKQDKKTWFVHSEEYRNAVLHFNHAMRLLKDNAPIIIEADKTEREDKDYEVFTAEKD